MHKYNEYITEIGDLAVKALVYELATTPKPGLVDKENSGAHTDMDYAMFRQSAQCLRNCYEQCALAGVEHDKEPLEWRLRKIGLAGEKEMFKVTGGVNTHKGLIFSLGIICAALGTLGSYQNIEASALQMRCREIARRILEINNTPSNTHGNQVYAKTGIYGAKGEALSGFNTAFKVGLPSLRNALKNGYSGNDAMVITLLNLMAVTEDSNLVYRGGLEGYEFAKLEARKLLEKDFDIEEVRKFDAECIERNLSPGGSADLLAITAMLHMIIE
ncbi:MAG: triphosphoribosyl-dephospho-CoA synthase [Firmicutes bacterium]|nr:triphosphoribosyl-dephospho-CoA synthase [Bacillota bacterium]